MQGFVLLGVDDAEEVLKARVAQAVLVAKDRGAKDSAVRVEIVGEEGNEVEEADGKCVVGNEVRIDEEEGEGDEETAKQLLWKPGVRYRDLMDCEEPQEDIDPVRVRITSANG